MLGKIDKTLSTLAGLLSEEPREPGDSGSHGGLMDRVEKGLAGKPGSENPTQRMQAPAPPSPHGTKKDFTKTPAEGSQQPFLSYADLRKKAEAEGGVIYVNTAGDHALIAFGSKNDVLDFVKEVPNRHQIGTFLGCRSATGQGFGKSQIVAVELKKG